MVGGYFDIPVPSAPRRSSVTDGTGRSSSPWPGVSPLPTPNELDENGLLDATGVQGQQRNAGILKSTNRVKFDAGLDHRPARSASENLSDLRTSQLPQRPLPIANIPTTDKISANFQSLPLEDPSSGSPASANGITIRSRASSVDDDINANDKGKAIHFAQERAQRLAFVVSRSKSPNPSTWSSLPSSAASTPAEAALPSEDGDDIPMISLPEKQFKEYDDVPDDERPPMDGRRFSARASAHRLAQRISQHDFSFASRARGLSPRSRPGQITPIEEQGSDYVEAPTHYRGGILSALLKLYDPRDNDPRGRSSRRGSAASLSQQDLSPDPNFKIPPRPRNWYDKSPNLSSASLSGMTLKESISSPISMLRRSQSRSSISSKRMGRPLLEEEIKIKVHIADLLARQHYLIRLCRALMQYGAPTYRLEEYMRMTARVLEIEAQFLYLPGCMIISFDDTSTHTAEVKVVRSNQGVELGKLSEVHIIYKEVIHDVIGVEEATQRLDKVMSRGTQHGVLFRILVHGVAAAAVGPFGFNARPIDIPIAFLLGCLLGVLQLVLAPRSELYANMFEVSAAVLTSFLARAFGSIQYNGEPLFCFSALAQSSLALILPGYIVLCASLELQSRNMVAGSIRLVYAIIYSLFLGFGITIGTAIYGTLDSNASTDYTCPPSPISDEYLQRFPFVIIFSACLALVNQAKWRQLPAMLVIAFAGFVVNYFATKRFRTDSQIANALAAFVVGLLANLYSRLRHGLAAAAMLPAIWVLVPSGLSASGSLVSAIVAAERMNFEQSPYAVVNNGTQGFVDAAMNMTSSQTRGMTFDVAYGMVQVAVGFTVGLFLAALVVYPLGKKRSGLFSF